MTSTTTAGPQPLPIAVALPPTPPPPPTQPFPTAENSDESLKLEIGIALLRSKLISQQPPPSSSHSSAFRWKQKAFSLTFTFYLLNAKDRKQEIIRLKEEIKLLEDDLRADLYPKSASCKCYFFNDELKRLSGDRNFTDFLRRRFLRQVRLHKRGKRTANKSTDRQAIADCYREEETEKLKLSAEFLVDLCDAPNPVKTPHFANLSHQAVDFIIGSLNHLLSMGKDAVVIVGIISSLIVRLVKRMCSPLEDELYCDPASDAQIHIQHIIRQLGSVAYIGQRVLLSVCHRISEQAEILASLDPFDESFALTHDAMFVMIQLIEFLVSDYLVCWAKDEGFATGLFEEWLTSFLHARKLLQLMEKRSALYGIYMDRVTGEVARRLGQTSFQALKQDVLDSLYS